MEVLNILFEATANPISITLVDYLVDAGHNVKINCSIHEFKKWKGYFRRGITHYPNEIYPRSEVDYIVDLLNKVQGTAIPKISLALDSNAPLQIASSLETPKGSHLVTQEVLPVEHVSTKAILEKLTDVFIDTIVILSRLPKGELPLHTQTPTFENQFQDYLNYLLLNEAHNLDTKALSERDDFYLGQELSGNISKCSLPLKTSSLTAVNLSAADLQVLTVSLMLLFNGRKEGVYYFNFYSKFNCNVVRSNKTPQYIDLSLTDAYSDLQNKIDRLYAVALTNPFYNHYDFKAQQKPIIAATYDQNPENEHEFALKYDSADNTLKITANEHWLNTTEIETACRSLIQKLAAFKTNDLSFLEYLQFDEDKRAKAIVCANENLKALPTHGFTHSLFESQCQKHPNKIAVSCGSESLTYKALNTRANQIAHLLKNRAQHGKSISTVIFMERSISMCTSLLATMKAGGTYTPLDLRFPNERIKAIIEDCKPAYILTSDQTISQINTILAEIAFSQNESAPIVLSLDNPALFEEQNLEDGSNHELSIQNEDLAYIIYTSGTTGEPKGVMVKHKSLTNLLVDIGERVRFNENDRLLSVTTIAFDISALEFYLPLINGGELIIAKEQDVLHPESLIKLIQEKQITVMQATPSLWYLVLQALQHKKLDIRVLTGGEELSSSLAKSLVDSATQVWNVYGPTETTIWSTIKEVQPDEALVTIGLPLANTSVYVLDDRGDRLPAGAVGELCIGGIGLAAGYLNKPAITERQFINNHLFTRENCKQYYSDKIYRTGDLGRQYTNAEIQYITRKDFQVKLNGFRIELEEIENALLKLNEVENCVALIKKMQSHDEEPVEHKYIVAYYVSKVPINDETLKAHLKQFVPEYMVPTFIVHLNEIPISTSGKINRRALPEPSIQNDNDIILPQSEIDQKLWVIWANVLALNVDKPNINSDFFNCGGNSMLAIRLVNTINRDLEANIKISDIFEHRSILKLSPLVQENAGDFIYKAYSIDTIDYESLYETYPLNNVQQAYAFGRFNHFELSSVSTHIYTEYVYLDLDVSRLEKSFNALLERHLALRTVFANDQQKYVKDYPYYRIKILDCPDQQHLMDIRQRYSDKLYDVEIYPMFDVLVSRYDNKYILHISFDAFIIDMSSFQILFDEWIQLYNNPDLYLPDLKVSHRDYSIQYERVRSSRLFRQAEAYWEQKINDYQFDVNLPLKQHPSTIAKPLFKRKTKVIPHAIWQKIVDKAQQRHISLTAVILEIYGRVLSHWTGQKALCINLTLFNRLPFHDQISDIIGDFTVLELFHYEANHRFSPIAKELQLTHTSLLLDIENNLFDGIDFQRMVRKKRSIAPNQILAPVVLTSVLGNITKGKSIFDLPINDTYQGVQYAISQTPQVWLDNKAYETEQGFVAEWDYVEQLFDAQMIEQMHDTYCQMLIKLADLDWENHALPHFDLSEVQVIEQANTATQPYSEDTLFGRYGKVVSSVKEKLAVVDSGTQKQHTHQALWDDSEGMAHYLIDFVKIHALPKHQLIAVLSEKGYNQVVSTLAIMKAGYAYLPLNVDWPAGRQADIIREGQCHILLVSRNEQSVEAIKEVLPHVQVLVIEDIIEGLRSTHVPVTSPLPAVHADDIAYVIFTSGSTGKPKGVTISHRGALNTLDAVNRRFEVKSDDSVFALSELSFDLSVYDIFGLLAVGGTIVFPAQSEAKNPKHWLDVIKKHQVTLWNTVPQLGSLLMDEMDEITATTVLRLFLLSGDWCPLNLPPRIKQHCHDATVMVLGGATEGSIWSIWHEADEIKPEWVSIPYGVAMPNQKMYVLNHQDNHCPMGVTGEIVIGGQGVALNYWGDEALTNQKYFYHPELGRLYRTGDLGKWHESGYIEFLGRKDFQVKIRGYRVELGEIEATLSQLPGIDKSLVCIQKNTDQHFLVAYLIPNSFKIQDDSKEAFKLAQHGLLNSNETGVSLQVRSDEARFRLRKSYRQFTKNTLNSSVNEQILQTLASVNVPLRQPSQKKTDLDETVFIEMISALSGITIKDKALPKYLYPSAGSTYSVRSYITFHQQINDEIAVGTYYYHPTQHKLIKVDKCFSNLNHSQAPSKLSLHFVVNWPAIKPLYSEHAKKMVYIETGHILKLLIDILDFHDINYDYQIINQDIDHDNTALLSFNVALKSRQTPPSSDTLQITYFQRDSNEYLSTDSDKVFKIDSLSVFQRASELGATIASGHGWITLAGKETPDNWVQAGLIFQKISTELYNLGIGSCVMGYQPFEDTTYSMIIGAIDEKVKLEFESQPALIPLSEVVSESVAFHLPDYMIPNHYKIIPELPLSANGKVDMSQLPKVDAKSEYTAPSTNEEIQLTEIWANILGIASEQISTNDKFFQLGGNSLSAMQAVRRINKVFGIKIRLNELYQYNTISSFIKQFSDKFTETECEEGFI